MDLTNFTSTFNYASNKASREIGSANKMNTIKNRLNRAIDPFYDDTVGSSMVKMARDSVGINFKSNIHVPSYKESIERFEHGLNKRSVKPALKERLSRSINDLEIFTNEKTLGHQDARKKVSDFIGKNREKYPKNAKALHEILSRPDEVYEVGKANLKPNITMSSQHTYNSSRINSIDKMISDFKDTSQTAASKTAKATGKETAKAVGQEAAEGVAEGATKKVGKSLLDKAVDMKIPQIALGVGVTAWLVNKLSDSRGQQSNAQLYGQQGY